MLAHSGLARRKIITKILLKYSYFKEMIGYDWDRIKSHIKNLISEGTRY